MGFDNLLLSVEVVFLKVFSDFSLVVNVHFVVSKGFIILEENLKLVIFVFVNEDQPLSLLLLDLVLQLHT